MIFFFDFLKNRTFPNNIKQILYDWAHLPKKQIQHKTKSSTQKSAITIEPLKISKLKPITHKTTHTPTHTTTQHTANKGKKSTSITELIEPKVHTQTNLFHEHTHGCLNYTLTVIYGSEPAVYWKLALMSDRRSRSAVNSNVFAVSRSCGSTSIISLNQLLN